MKLGTYVVGQGDTLEILSRLLLGDAGQEDALIRINKLRYPYISDNPIDQYANRKGRINLKQAITNTSYIEYDNSNGVVILPSDTIIFSEGSHFEAHTIESVTSTVLTLSKSVSGTFREGSIVTVYANQQNVSTQVLRTGETLFYPFDADAGAEGDYELVIGTDWRLDENGFLARADRGDVDTISGYDNLFQSLRVRLATPMGSLKLHPDYGNELFDHIGDVGTPYFPGLAKYYITECANQDPRVMMSDVIDFAINEDGSMTFLLNVIPNGSQDAINQRITIPIKGV